MNNNNLYTRNENLRELHSDYCGFCCATFLFIILIIVSSDRFGPGMALQLLIISAIIISAFFVFCCISFLCTCVGDILEEERNKPREIEMVNIRSKEICSICLEPCKVGVELVCTHKFHKKCIKKWTSENQSCPNCRLPV